MSTIDINNLPDLNSSEYANLIKPGKCLLLLDRPWMDQIAAEPTSANYNGTCSHCTTRRKPCTGPPRCIKCQQDCIECVWNTRKIAKAAQPKSQTQSAGSSTPSPSMLVSNANKENINNTITATNISIPPAKKQRKTRCDKGVKRGKRKAASADVDAEGDGGASVGGMTKKRRVEGAMGDVTSGVQDGGAASMDVDK